MTTQVPPRSGDATPAEREDRIRALRLRRRERAREVALRAVFLGTGLVLLLVVAAWWLLGTLGGRDVLLSQIVARLPAGSTLTWQRAEGPASGPMVLHGVRFVLPRQRDPDCEPAPGASCAMGEIVFTAGRVMLDPHVMPLLGWRLRLERLEITDARLSLPEGDKPFELPEWPEVLPAIQPPLSLRVDALDIDGLAIDREGVPLVEIHDASGGLDARAGSLHVEQLVASSDRGRFTLHGDYAPTDGYRTDLVATWVAPGQDAQLGLVARGDLDRMLVAVAGDAPSPVRAILTLGTVGAGSTDDPHWQLAASTEGFDPTLFATDAGGDAPLVELELEAEGIGGRAELEGRFARGDLEAVVLPSRVRLEDQVLEVDPLRLQMLDGALVLRGSADFSEPRDARFDVAARADGLRWGDAGTQQVVADAKLDIEGAWERWTVAGTADLRRGDLQADIRLDGVGDSSGVALRALHARMPTGTLDAEGRLDWSPALAWTADARLAGFDPAYFLPGWEGAVDGRLRSRGTTRPDGGIEVAVAVDDLGGTLRGRALDGSGHVEIHGAPPAGGTTGYEGELALTLGDSRIDAAGRIGGDVDLVAHLSPLHLADLLPDASGTLRGDLHLRGPRAAPGITVDLAGSDVRVAGLAAATLSLRGNVPATGDDGALALRAGDVSVAGFALDAVRVDARGSWSRLAVDAEATGEGMGRIALAGSVGRRGPRWQGTLGTLRIAPERGPAWALRAPAQFAWQPGRATLSQACLSSGEGAVCATADWPRNGATVTGTGLPLALAAPYLPRREDDRDWLLRGEVAIDARLRPAGRGFAGTALVTSPSGGLKFSERARREIVQYQDLRLAAEFDASRIVATLDATLFEGDPLSARVATGWSAGAPLDGALALQTDALTWMELLSPDLVDPTGQLEVDIGLSGTRGAPVLQGRASLRDFGAQLPALAIELSDGELVLAAQADGAARIDGQVRTGPAGGPPGGTLHVDGSLGWRGGDTPLVLHVTGQEVLVSATRDLRAVASPDVTVRAAPGAPVEVTGTVVVPEALIDLERLDRGIAPSPDVVVLDPVNPEGRNAPVALALDLTLVLGDDVVLRGFGLDGSLDGSLRVVQAPGSEMTASGTLVASGTYSAYGQELEITRGRLSWSDDPVSDPVLDLRAERDLGNVTAGVDVRGRASAPRATVWSNPATSQSEALAYLALGRPISTTSPGERESLSAASAALSAGGTLLASQLAASIGLDDAGVLQSRALGGSVFGIGKYLSPRLYVSYGVSLLGTGQVLTLKYLLDHGFDIEVESSTVENRATVNWRTER
ncbi:MAG TPA: translocation/assembly module TamB domain-containing protein [Xanthomonadaceae bacterium]|nr:translocation/assembly module TamB domain-containing protein [Xanthomonadaceae bacterium]